MSKSNSPRLKILQLSIPHLAAIFMVVEQSNEGSFTYTQWQTCVLGWGAVLINLLAGKGTHGQSYMVVPKSVLEHNLHNVADLSCDHNKYLM